MNHDRQQQQQQQQQQQEKKEMKKMTTTDQNTFNLLDELIFYNKNLEIFLNSLYKDNYINEYEKILIQTYFKNNKFNIYNSNKEEFKQFRKILDLFKDTIKENEIYFKINLIGNKKYYLTIDKIKKLENRIKIFIKYYILNY